MKTIRPAAIALTLALLLNPGFPWPGRHALVLWLLIAFFYTVLWTVMSAVAVVLMWLLARLRRKGDSGTAAGRPAKGYRP